MIFDEPYREIERLKQVIRESIDFLDQFTDCNTGNLTIPVGDWKQLLKEMREESK